MHIILDGDKKICKIGENYTTPRDTDLYIMSNGVTDRPVHCVNGARFDYENFSHMEVDNIPNNITVGDFYIDGVFIKEENE